MATSSLPPREPHLLRFRLRQMFFVVTLLSVFCALLVLTDGPWPLVIGVGAALVAAHVFGTLIGTRLRDTSHEVVRWRAANPKLEDSPRANLRPSDSDRLTLPPTTPLANRGQVSHWPLRLVAAGAVVGLIVGGIVTWIALGSRIGWAGWLVGTISCGVLGTWAAFLASSFSTIARHAWRHAHGKDK